MMKKIGYVRCAASQEGETGLERQRAALLGSLGVGDARVEWVEDVGSGMRLGQGFEALLARAESGEAMEIRMTRLDRIARDGAVVQAALERARRAGAVVVLLSGEDQTQIGVAIALGLAQDGPARRRRRG